MFAAPLFNLVHSDLDAAAATRPPTPCSWRDTAHSCSTLPAPPSSFPRNSNFSKADSLSPRKATPVPYRSATIRKMSIILVGKILVELCNVAVLSHLNGYVTRHALYVFTDRSLFPKMNCVLRIWCSRELGGWPCCRAEGHETTHWNSFCWKRFGAVTLEGG